MIYDDPRSLEGELEAARYEEVESLADQAAILQPLQDAVNAPGWLDIVAHLMDEEAKAVETLVHRFDPNLIARTQGRVQLIQELIALPQSLSERLKSLHEQMEEK